MSNFVTNCLEWLFGITQAVGFPSYALAIIILTAIIKLILFPLNMKQMKSMRDIQKLQPLIADLDKKYASNPQKKQEEMLKLYQEHKINPIAGCLPLLIQMPIIIVLYRGLLAFVPANPEYNTFFWITNLSEPDPSKFIFPVLVAVFTFLQSYVSTGKPKDTMQKTMVYGMPLMLGWMAMNFPSGICLYWIVFSIASIIQQLIINKGKDGIKKDEDGQVIDVKPEKSEKDDQRHPKKKKK